MSRNPSEAAHDRKAKGRRPRGVRFSRSARDAHGLQAGHDHRYRHSRVRRLVSPILQGLKGRTSSAPEGHTVATPFVDQDLEDDLLIVLLATPRASDSFPRFHTPLANVRPAAERLI